MADILPTATVENRCVFHVVSSANYHYTHPVRHVQTYVRLVPPSARGLQRVLAERLQIAPLPHYQIPEAIDRWGNRVFEIRHNQIDENLTMIADLTVETAARYTPEGVLVPTPIPPSDLDHAERRIYGEFTPRTQPSAALEQVAHDLQSAHSATADPFAFAVALRERVHGEMEFTAGATHVGTTAAEAWGNRRGVCQDLTHIAIALFRLSGISARYVSGFVPGEGVMHAWVEILLALPEDQGASTASHAAPVEKANWYAIDPTYNRWRNERCVTVAVGRDYGDATPLSGTYFGSASRLQYGTVVETVRSERVLL